MAGRLVSLWVISIILSLWVISIIHWNLQKILMTISFTFSYEYLQGMSTEIKCECLDILCDVLHRFGNLMTSDHHTLLASLLSQLGASQASVRKKSISCLGN